MATIRATPSAITATNRIVTAAVKDPVDTEFGQVVNPPVVRFVDSFFAMVITTVRSLSFMKVPLMLLSRAVNVRSPIVGLLARMDTLTEVVRGRSRLNLTS